MTSSRSRPYLQHSDCSFKLLLIGQSSVGKTSLLLQYTAHTFVHHFYGRVSYDSVPPTQRRKEVCSNGQSVELTIWDTIGQERYLDLGERLYRNSSGILLVYDVGKRETFEKMGRWVDSTKQSAQGAVLLLVGNKSDLMRERAVSFEDGKMLADQLGVLFMETSAKTGSNIAETFQVFVERMLAEKHASPAPQNQPIN